jgi:isopenicillin-N epimerase
MAPKGSAFLYARSEHHHWLEPLIVSWGYQSGPDFSTGSRFLDYYQWLGTRDLAAFLAVPAAIEFQRQQKWDAVRDRCHHLARDTRRRINALTGLAPICPETSKWFGQMCAVRLPDVDLPTLKTRLYDEFHIEVPVFNWNGMPLIRISIQGYNNQADADTLVEALVQLLFLHRG